MSKKTKVFPFRIDIDLFDKIKKRAEFSDRSINKELINIVKNAVNE